MPYYIFRPPHLPKAPHNTARRYEEVTGQVRVTHSSRALQQGLVRLGVHRLHHHPAVVVRDQPLQPRKQRRVRLHRRPELLHALELERRCPGLLPVLRDLPAGAGLSCLSCLSEGDKAAQLEGEPAPGLFDCADAAKESSE